MNNEIINKLEFIKGTVFHDTYSRINQLLYDTILKNVTEDQLISGNLRLMTLQWLDFNEQ